MFPAVSAFRVLKGVSSLSRQPEESMVKLDLSVLAHTFTPYAQEAEAEEFNLEVSRPTWQGIKYLAQKQTKASVDLCCFKTTVNPTWVGML